MKVIMSDRTLKKMVIPKIEGHNDFWCTCPDEECMCTCPDCEEDSIRMLMENV